MRTRADRAQSGGSRRVCRVFHAEFQPSARRRRRRLAMQFPKADLAIHESARTSPRGRIGGRRQNRALKASTFRWPRYTSICSHPNTRATCAAAWPASPTVPLLTVRPRAGRGFRRRRGPPLCLDEDRRSEGVMLRVETHSGRDSGPALALELAAASPGSFALDPSHYLAGPRRTP